MQTTAAGFSQKDLNPPTAGRGRASSNDNPWRATFVFWLAVTALLVGFTVFKADGVPYFGDDAMRMVTIVELLNGQHWQDLSLVRDNAPFGTTMHWSRLIDLPIAGMAVLMRPFLSEVVALDVAATIWSSLLLLALLVLSVRFVRATVPEADTITALALPVVSVVILIEYLPGRVDHHNVQMLLGMLSAIALTAMRTRVWGGVIAGVASATSLAIGMESIPVVAATVAIFALLWLADPSRYRRPLIAFGATVAAATCAHFLFATAPRAYFVAACDMLSIAYVVPAIVGGGALAATAAATTDDRGGIVVRSILLGIGGGATLGTVAWFFPECLAGPYAMADALISLPGYLDTISEARSLGTMALLDPTSGAIFAAAVLIALPVTIWATLKASGEDRVTWLVVLGFLAVTLFVMTIQIRGARLATPFALPAAAWLITKAREAYLRRGNVLRGALLAGGWLLFSGATYYGLALGYYTAVAPEKVAEAAFATTDHMATQCLHKDNYARLASLPAGRVMSPFRLGPHILLFTPHETVSAGFHRNFEGTRDAIDFFLKGEAHARMLAESRAVDYVVICPRADDYVGAIGPDARSHWPWLAPITDPAEPLQIYRVTL